jgi:dihydrofolate reductase
MRRICYAVAMSLDGYIAGPNGEVDWIVQDAEINFRALFTRFDTFLMGRRTFELAQKPGAPKAPGVSIVVVSRTLRPADYPDLQIVSEDLPSALADLRARPGKEIWLFGGTGLFHSLIELGEVDAIEVAVIPVLLGGGLPLLPTANRRAKLQLTGSRVYQKSGIVRLEYTVERTA